MLSALAQAHHSDMPPDESASPSLSELVSLCAADSGLFAHTFFPRVVRQESPPFDREVWRRLDSHDRLVNLQIFRGGAKTTRSRIATSKRIAYGLARTGLYIGKSEGHALRSGRWIRRQIEHNRFYADTFGLRKGDKWQDGEMEIWHGVDEHPIYIVCLGIGGSIRGLLEGDDAYRPDWIMIDDVIDEENASTPEQRQKINGLILGALKESLAPASESPHAKMAMLQTPQNREDASTLAMKDPEWESFRQGCWTKDTEHLPLAKQVSAWPARWTSETLQAEKAAAIQRNQLSIWLREKECTLISPETSAFKPSWLKFYELAPERKDLTIVIAIDPVPPPSDIQVAKGMRGKDFEALVVVGRHKGDFYLLDYELNRGHEPNWTVAKFFELALRWRPRKVLVESVAYQRTLAWILRQAMQHQRRYWAIEEWTDKRKKFDRIVDGVSGPGSNGKVYVKASHTTFIQQWNEYPDVSNDDLLEGFAVAVSSLQGLMGEDDDSGAYDELMREERDIPALNYELGCP